MTDHPTGDAQCIVGVEVRRYKNLVDVWLPWSDGVALFGINGAGKTNLLECLALLLGTDQTLRLGRPRLIDPAADDLSIIVLPGRQSLPWPPDVALTRPTQDVRAHSKSTILALNRWISDADWWRLLGSRGGSDFAQGVATAELPDGVAAFVGDLARAPVVRYTLTRLTHGSNGIHREFARTLLSPSLPVELAAISDVLPDAFAPLRSHVASSEAHPAGWVPVLELPATQQAPAVLQWLPRLRTSDEANSDLESAFDSARAPAQRLADALGELPLASAPLESDSHWWLHKLGETYGAAELELTLPGVSISADGGYDAAFRLAVKGAGAYTEIGLTGQDDVLEYFSSGERRWVDESLATMARELRKFARRAGLYAEILGELDADTVMAAVLASDIDESIKFEGYWSDEAFDRLIQALEPALVATAKAKTEREQNVVIRELMRQLRPGLLALEPSLIIRAFDEPEAHLHPRAQRRAAQAIDQLRTRGENVVVATHSPYFLDLPLWSQVHVRPDGSGTHLERIPEESGHARTALAADLGINRGELLAGINGILLVEGTHDQIVLQRLFGSQLRAANLKILRMHGTDNLLATAELDFIEQYLDVPVIVLLDHTRVEHVHSGRATTDEEQKLIHLRRSLKRRNRAYHFVGLERPDIVCYLSETAVRHQHPTFPGWPGVLRDFQERRSRPKFKEWLRERFEVDLTETRYIERVLDCMQEDGHRPVGELTRKVNEIVSHLDDKDRRRD